MVRLLLILVSAFVVMLPACLIAVSGNAVAGNTSPNVYFEVFYQPCDPADPDCPGAPDPPMGLPPEACVHPGTYPFRIPCYAPRVAGNFYIISVHIERLDMPICQTTGPECANFGGFLGLGFGAVTVGGTGLTFMSWNACPGFLKGPSAAGEPAACLASATGLCHDWYDHEGYLLYLNISGTTMRFINVANSADLGHLKVINCVGTYDDGTVIGVPGGVQIGGSQTVACRELPVEEATWGEIKTLFQ